MFDSTILQSRNLRHLPNAFAQVIATTMFCLAVAATTSDSVFGDPIESDSGKTTPSGLAVDRKTTLVVASFRQHVANSRFDAAVDDFQRLQTSDAVLMVPAGDSGRTFAPLYRILFSSFFELPSTYQKRIAQGLEIPARRRLMQIVAEFDYGQIPDLIRQYAGTEASLQAHILMARQHLDRGNTLGVRAWVAPLTLGNVDERYRQVALKILTGLSSEAITEGSGAGRDVPSGQRNGIPDQVSWQFRTVTSQKVQRHLNVFMNVAIASNVTPHTTWRGLSDRGVNYRRTLQGLVAVDLASGEPLWQYPLQPQLDTNLSNARSDGSVFGQGGSMNAPAGDLFPAMERTALANLFCRDNVTGQVAGDSDRLYVVSNLGTPAISGSSSPAGFFSRTRSTSFRGSQLIALEKASGRRVWSSGERAFDAGGEASSKVWFAGVPAVFRNRLYSVVERDGEIRLACLATRTGELLWSTQLAWPDQSIDKDPFRQMRSATPTVQQGIVWCSTTTGWVTCVDEITRTVLWTSDVRGKKVVEFPAMPRGVPVVVSPWASVRSSWATPRILLATDSLVVLPHESHEICLLNPATGDFDHRVPVKPSSTLLHIDNELIVYCEESRFVCRNSRNAEVKWSLDVGAAGLPAGPAISKDDSLLVPMTTGRILCVELSSGEIAEQTDPVLPALAWGHLTLANAEGDLLYSTPDRLIRLSSKRLKTQPGKPIEVAAALLDAKKWNEALSLANGILQQQPGNAEAKDICFQCRLSLAVNAPGLHLPQLKQMKKLPKQQIQVRALEVEVLIGQQKFQEAAFRLAEILTLETALLPLSYQGSIGQPGSEEIVIEKSFHSWATLELSALLERIPDPESIITQLEGATVSVLLSLHHPALLPTIHARCQSSNSYEESVQLLRHAVDIKSSGTAESSGGVSPTFRQEAELLRQLVKKLGEDASSPSLIALLNILALESPPEFLAAARSSDAFGATGLLSEETLRKQLYTQQQDEFGKWSAGPYHAIPVARLRSSGRVEKTLSLAEPDDLFLSRFQWSATAGEYGRLQVKNAVDRNVAQWSIPGNFQLHGTYSFQRDLLLRAGSVLLVKSYAGITAVSALDRRVLWSRTFPYVAGTRPSSVEQNFARLGTQKGYLPSQKLSSSFQVVGAGHGWLALTNGKTFSVVEIYSGRTKWSMTLPPNAAGVVASDTRVWVTFEDRSVASFSAEDGQGLSTPNVAEEPITPLRNVENQFVCWKQSADRHDPRLQWVDSSTNEIVDEVDLGQMQRFRFVDDSTLVGFNEQHQVQVVNLRSRVSKTLSFTPTVVEPQDSAEEGLPMWDPGRMQLALDGLNYYLCNRSKNNGELTRSPANRQLMVFDGDLIALDRQSGKQRWEFSNSNVLMSTVDQPELPVMVLVDASTPVAAGQTAGPSTFYGISKMAGRQLFEQSLPMQSSLRTLSIGSPAVDILDIGVQGLRVRIQAVQDQG